MDDITDLDPLGILMRAAGMEWNGWETIDADALEAPLRFIQTPPETMSAAKQAIVNGLSKNRIRLPTTGHHISAQDIHVGLVAIENGLRQLAAGLSALAYARQTTDATIAPVRAAALEDAHRFVLGVICSAMPAGLGISDDQIANAVPEYDRLGSNDQWRGAFERAAGQLKRGRAAWMNEDFAMPTRTREVERDDLIADLGKIFQEITGDKPTAWRPAGNIKQSSRSKFHEFVAMLWPLTGETRLPSADVIQAAVHASRPLPPG